MSGFVKFARRAREPSESTLAPAKAAKAAKQPPEFSKFSRFSDAPTESAHTPEAERREWTDALCRRLSDAVARETPTRLGRWEPAWQRVEAPSNTLLDALAEFEATGRDEDKQAAVRLAGDVLQAWRSAATEWERAGRPIPQPGHALTS